MNPLRIQATNYRSFVDLDLHLPTGVCAVTGANGAGKSSIINLIDLALFGAEGRTLADYVTEGATGDLELTLTFEHAGETYRVRRGYSPKGRGRSTLDFERLDPEARGLDPSVIVEGWFPLTQGTAKETQALIEQTIGLSRKTWRASAFLAQGDGAAFTDADPKDRKAILAEVLSLDVWDDLKQHATTDRQTAEREIAQLDGETSVLRDQAAAREVAEFQKTAAEREESEAMAALAAAEREVADVAEQVRAAETATAARKATEATHAAAVAEHTRVVKIRDEADWAAGHKADALEELASLATVDEFVEFEQQHQTIRDKLAAETLATQEWEAAHRESTLKAAQRDAITAQAEDLRGKARALRENAAAREAAGAGETTCDHCGQTLGVEALSASLLSTRNQADEYERGAVTANEQAAQIEIPSAGEPPTRDASLPAEAARLAALLTVARGDQEQRARLTERIRSLDEKIAAGEGIAASLATAAAVVAEAERAVAELGPSVDLDTLRGRVVLFQGRVDDTRGKLDQARRRKAVADHALEQITAAETALAETAARREALQKEIDLVADLERAYGRDGIPALIVESQAIPMIEADANRILADLGTSYRVELHTQRALKTGGGLRDTLDVIVVADGGSRAYETFSGGEKTRLNLALRIALARLLAHRRGADSRLLAIDEPDGLDADGFARLAEVLRAESDTFSKVFVISHHPDLAGAFDVTLEVVKEDGCSRVAA